MPSFSLAIEYLTGYSVATDPANREKAEWPPHPARVFMALAAAHFETDDSSENKQAERAALEWLAALPPPALALPKQATLEFASPRKVLTVYVPVNDSTGAEAIPSKRPRQPRSFPRIFVGDEPIRYVWSAEEESLHLDALESLCRKVTRIGHSSSFVWVRLERTVDASTITHEPSNESLETRLRITGNGALDYLQQSFNAENIQSYANLERQITAASSKKEAKFAKDTLVARFPGGQPISRRPSFSINSGYRHIEQPTSSFAHSTFDPNFIVLTQSEDSPHSFGLESTLLLTQALRGLIQKECGIQPVPDWISGHNGPNGPRLADGRSHIALAALPFVQVPGSSQRQYADGHVMGLAIFIPREVSARDRAKALGPILFNERNEPRALKLTLGRAGEFHAIRDTSFSPKYNLRPLTWTEPGTCWRTVTPIVLDRIPKSDRVKERQQWNEEVAAIIHASCRNAGLPEAISIRPERTPLLLGSLRAMPGQGGFPLLRPGTFQIHAEIEFAERVQGPVLLGAGRFRGYGFCRPIQRDTAQ